MGERFHLMFLHKGIPLSDDDSFLGHNHSFGGA